MTQGAMDFNVQETSLKTWREINENGLLKKLKLKVYNFIFENPSLNAREIERDTGIRSNTLHGVLRPLVKAGAIEMFGTKRCPLTGNETNCYRVTGKIPVEPKRQRTKRDLINELRDDMKAIHFKILHLTTAHRSADEVYNTLSDILDITGGNLP